MVNNSKLIQMKKNVKKQPYAGVWILRAGNIPKPLEYMMKIKSIYDVTSLYFE